MAYYDREFNIDFFEKLLEMGKEKEALKLVYDLFNENDKIKKMFTALSVMYLKNGNHKKALPVLKEILFLDPKNESVRFDLGLIYFSCNNYAKATEMFEPLVGNTRFSGRLFPYLSFAYLMEEKDNMAIELINKREFLLSRDDEIYMIGMKLIEKKYPELAKELFLKLVKEGRKSVFTIYGLGISYFSCEEFERAKECFEEVLTGTSRVEKEFNYLYIGLGVSYFQLGEYEKALKIFLTAVENNVFKGEAFFYIGLIYFKLGNFESAISNLREAGKLNPKDPEVWKVLGDVYYEINDLENAKISYKKCYKLTEDMNFAFRVGLIAILKKDFQEAYKFFKICLENKKIDNSLRVEILKQLVLAAYYINKYEETLIYSRELLEKGVRDERFFLVISNSLLKLGIIDESEEILSLALKIYPESSALTYTLGMVKSNQLKYEEADILFEKAISIERNPDFLYASALTKMKLNDKLSAIKLFSEFQNYQNDPERLYRVALFFIELGAKDKAKEVFERILSIQPDNNMAKEYLKT